MLGYRRESTYLKLQLFLFFVSMLEIFHFLSAILVLCALFAYLNHRYIHLPASLGLMLAGLLVSLVLIAGASLSPELYEQTRRGLQSIDFSELLLDIMLSFLLFAGALHTDLDRLKNVRGPILGFATLGVLLTTFLLGGLMYGIFQLFSLDVPLLLCLLFGAMVAPTDPIAVMGSLKKAKVPPALETKIVGESLFNDGVGVVIFLIIYQLAERGLESFDAGFLIELLLMEVLGGLLLGVLSGYVVLQMMKRLDHYQTEVLLTLALVTGAYSLAQLLHFSGPLAMVAAGLIIGNYGKGVAMSDVTLDYVHKFWEMLDEVLNAILFVLIGLELILIPFEGTYILLAVIAFILMLAVRFFSLWFTATAFRLKRDFLPNTLKIMTWGGLRGGISIALALSLQEYMAKDILLNITYLLVLASLLIQGLTIERFLKRFRPELP
jgi:CPA1 family monovalent cation:H+ antiporter